MWTITFLFVSGLTVHVPAPAHITKLSACLQVAEAIAKGHNRKAEHERVTHVSCLRRA